MNVRPDGIFWTAEPFASKPRMMMHHHKLECKTNRLVYYLQGHSQSMTIAVVLFDASVHSFFILFSNLVLIYGRNGPRYQHALALCAFLTGVIPKGLIFENFVFDVCVCFVLCKFVSGLVLGCLDNLWFDDLREEWIEERLDIVSSRDVILCG